MQALKDKLNDMSHMRRAKAEAKEEEQEEKNLAKTRVEVAKEVRLAREAEAAMDLHVNKAAEKVAHHEAKHTQHNYNTEQLPAYAAQDPYGANLYNDDYSVPHQTYGDDLQDPYTGRNTPSNLASDPATGTGYPTNRVGGTPPNNLL